MSVQLILSLAVVAVFLANRASAIRCSNNYTSFTSGLTSSGSSSGGGGTADCGSGGKYCVTGNATVYVTTTDSTFGRVTSKTVSTFHACDNSMGLIGDLVLQGYKNVKCQEDGESEFSDKNWDKQGESISGYIDCSPQSDGGAALAPLTFTTLVTTGLLIAITRIVATS